MFTSTSDSRIKHSLDQSELFLCVLIDQEGNLLYLNDHFRKRFYQTDREPGGERATEVFAPGEWKKLETLFFYCRSNPGTVFQEELKMLLGDGRSGVSRWEFIRVPGNDEQPACYQGIGILLSQPPAPERYSAYEQGTEGLWMFELRNPVPRNTSPEQMIAHFRNDAFLAECNDAMAQMYGFSKAGELIGLKLDNLMDFNDHARVEGLKQFVRDGFVSSGVESKEFDRDGNVLYFLNNMTGVIEHDRLVRVWGTQQNITEQRLAEQRLLKSELFYKNLITDSLDAILLSDEQGVISFVSPSVTRILGYHLTEVQGKNMFEFVHPDDLEMAKTTFEAEVQMNPNVKFINIRLLNKHSGWTWYIVRAHNMLHNPYIGKIGIYFFDDTSRKQTEAALLEAERKFRAQATVLRNVTDVIITTDLQRVITSWNKVAEKLIGLSEEEVLGKKAREVLNFDFHPFTTDQVVDIVLREGLWRGEMNYILANGARRIMLNTISLLQNDHGENIGFLGVAKDITDRKEAEERLQESEFFYRSLIAHSLDGIIMTSEKEEITYCGPSVMTLTGYEPGDLLGRNVFDFVHPEDVGAAREAFNLELQKASVFDYMMLRLLHSDGSWFWCSVRCHNHLDNPALHSMAVYFTDESRRKEMEDRLRKSEQYFRSLIYNIKQGIVLQDFQGKTILSNDAILEMMDLDIEQIMGQKPMDPRWNVIYEDGKNFPASEYPFQYVLQTKEPQRDIVMGVYRPSIGDRVWLLVNAEPILDANNELINVICSFTDITEQRRMSQELVDQEIQKQKQLTQATIDGQEKERQEIGKELHDNINQHLNTTRLYLEVAREKAEGEVLEMVNLAHKNLTAIVNEIRHLSQSLVPPTLGDLGLVESIHELCDAIKRANPFVIEFMYRHFDEEGLPDNMKLMLFRITQEQVNNIVRHAHAKTIQIKLQADAEYVILTIADDGVGFNPDSFRKGLGFHNITSRAALFNGKVEIDAALGYGCAISVIIPLTTTA